MIVIVISISISVSMISVIRIITLTSLIIATVINKKLIFVYIRRTKPGEASAYYAILYDTLLYYPILCTTLHTRLCTLYTVLIL